MISKLPSQAVLKRRAKPAFQLNRGQRRLYDRLVQKLSIFIRCQSMRQGLKQGFRDLAEAFRDSDFPIEPVAGGQRHRRCFDSVAGALKYIARDSTQEEYAVAMAQNLLSRLKDGMLIFPTKESEFVSKRQAAARLSAS